MRLIDADALYEKAEEKYKCSAGVYRPIYRGFVDDVANATTVDAVPVVHGRWGEYEPFRGWPCTACGKYVTGEEPTFAHCPNCGAKMDGGDKTDC